jgi:hypothetical protein
VQKNIGIRMTLQTLFIRNLYTPDDQLSTPDQPMDVVPESDAHENLKERSAIGNQLSGKKRFRMSRALVLYRFHFLLTADR